ncbi:hypothetical protein [Actinokineospora iranica]|uniref:Uncharacterized protein n=1 Tax=Actinokineospora iranica TaxID=1271860 RepID=A0A1G6VSV1_9PSEU|nr:hypothetical protein [Actinokineospora iranica]SDD56513.1 hypothetical protein SAMN05216174_11371 [Actinokineospora iranica]
MTAPTENRSRRRAGAALTAVLLGALALVGGLIAVLIARGVTPPAPAAGVGWATSTPAATNTGPSTGSNTGSGSDDNALATRPMLQLPPQAAQPQVMSTESAGPPIEVPKPQGVAERWIADGFPATPEGALGQLKALDEAAMTTADPAAYERGFREVAETGAPDPRTTGLFSLLTSLRAKAQLPATGSVSGVSGSYRVTHGHIKGTSADRKFAVVCVLGHFTISARGQVVSAGVGDCQAMRWNGTRWRIASGPLAAPAPSAWPGSADAIRAGYREVV